MRISEFDLSLICFVTCSNGNAHETPLPCMQESKMSKVNTLSGSCWITEAFLKEQITDGMKQKASKVAQ
ncbi:hypothetical protein SDJN02_00347, partial [Cucurbita argyrosperma subsp. argyrosperma]